MTSFAIFNPFLPPLEVPERFLKIFSVTSEI